MRGSGGGILADLVGLGVAGFLTAVGVLDMRGGGDWAGIVGLMCLAAVLGATPFWIQIRLLPRVFWLAQPERREALRQSQSSAQVYFWRHLVGPFLRAWVPLVIASVILSIAVCRPPAVSGSGAVALIMVLFIGLAATAFAVAGLGDLMDRLCRSQRPSWLSGFRILIWWAIALAWPFGVVWLGSVGLQGSAPEVAWKAVVFLSLGTLPGPVMAYRRWQSACKACYTFK